MLESSIFAAGIAQIILVIGSLAIPRVLGWSQDTAKLRPLTRQVFWTYAGYIWVTNLAFGLLSSLAPSALLDGSVLAFSVSLYITVYWLARVIIQFVYFDRSDAPQGKIFVAAEFVLVVLFISLTLIHGMAAWTNIPGAAY